MIAAEAEQGSVAPRDDMITPMLDHSIHWWGHSLRLTADEAEDLAVAIG
ncbi:hypothetical protein BpOF4_21734 (plasmid) [Alkalihalophilus pseudofirmus OF4]|uniref:Uncharacterized protein n=2 Tax=Bacillaceae TaxID=186817 RepID=D3G1W6_ALKPO|nr:MULTISPECIES: hypothetical protein [Alkalihalophilus]AAA75479.1 orf2 [Cytobacillus firmus]ADC52342.1 hypothetical protein BpOF4_21734 [Alkalihalophilus pseudofirmus OF4]MED1602968.1 hypothetical protein [Alkalihalophilus marmarensis]